MAPNSGSDLQVLFTDILGDGFDTVTRSLPQKIMSALHLAILAFFKYFFRDLQRILQTYQLSARATQPSSQQNKKRKFSDISALSFHSLPSSTPPEQTENTANMIMHNIIKTDCDFLARFSDQAKLWLMLSTISTTKNSRCRALFQHVGADIQQNDLVSELHRAQDAAISMRDGARKYCADRADLCSRIKQHPDIVDYQNALQEYDEQDQFLSQQHLRDIMNIYILLHGLLQSFIPPQ